MLDFVKIGIMTRIEYKIIEKIYESSLKFLEALNPAETFSTIVNEAVKLVNGEYGSILLEHNKELVRVYASSPIAYQTQIRKNGNTYTCFKDKKPVLDTINKMKKAHPELKDAGIRSTLFIPLTNKGSSIGVLTVNSKNNNEFTEYELHILQLFGAMASLAIRKTQLYEETKKALEMRDMFISMASHELRTPITTISGYVQLLQTRMKNDNSITKVWMDELGRELERLTLLVKELLEINRIKSGNLQYNFKKANITEIVERAVRTIKFGYPDRRIIFENRLRESDNVIGDYDKLLQVVNNVLENAAKYSDGSEEIKLILSKSSNQLRIRIKDKGIGIPTKELPDIFKGYVQGKNHTREGLGLGLFLTKSIVDKHLGQIKIKSAENKGTTVEILLPQTKLN